MTAYFVGQKINWYAEVGAKIVLGEIAYLCHCVYVNTGAYSQKIIDISRLFDPTYLQIGHVISYSRSFNNSMNNKVLVLLEENQKKGN